MGKLLKLFAIGLAITLISGVILFWGGSVPVDRIIMIFPAAIGVALMMLSTSIALKKWIRGLERD